MEIKDAIMMLQSMRDQRLSVEVLSELLIKASEATALLDSLTKRKAEIEGEITQIAKLRDKRQADFETMKADLVKNEQLLADAKGKLASEYQAAIDGITTAKQDLAKYEADAAKRIAKLDADIAAKEKQVDKATGDLEKIAKNAAHLASSIAA